MQVEIRSQFMVDDKRPIHLGEILEDSDHQGAIGWIDWCNERESRDDILTAKLEIIGSMFEVYVVKDARTPDLNIGEDLFIQLVYRLRSLGYVDFIIIGAIDSAMPFYQHVIDSLIKAGDAESYTVIEGEGRNTVDNHDLRITFTPKDVFLPG